MPFSRASVLLLSPFLLLVLVLMKGCGINTDAHSLYSELESTIDCGEIKYVVRDLDLEPGSNTITQPVLVPEDDGRIYEYPDAELHGLMEDYSGSPEVFLRVELNDHWKLEVYIGDTECLCGDQVDPARICPDYDAILLRSCDPTDIVSYINSDGRPEHYQYEDAIWLLVPGEYYLVIDSEAGYSCPGQNINIDFNFHTLSPQ